jgi:hypothetical protein
VEIPHLALGGVHGQLVALLEAARADATVELHVSCGAFAVDLSFADGPVAAQTGETGTGGALSLEDEAVLLILGWRRDHSRGPFYREWHRDTLSADIAEDIMRTARHAYECEDIRVALRMRETEAAR